MPFQSPGISGIGIDGLLCLVAAGDFGIGWFDHLHLRSGICAYFSLHAFDTSELQAILSRLSNMTVGQWLDSIHLERIVCFDLKIMNARQHGGVSRSGQLLALPGRRRGRGTLAGV